MYSLLTFWLLIIYWKTFEGEGKETTILPLFLCSINNINFILQIVKINNFIYTYILLYLYILFNVLLLLHISSHCLLELYVGLFMWENLQFSLALLSTVNFIALIFTNVAIAILCAFRLLFYLFPSKTLCKG